MMENCDQNLTMVVVRQGELENMSGSDGISFDDTEHVNRISNKKTRHTPHQTKELESFFHTCPLPDEMERLALGQRLGLNTQQVKFWFQNRRTNAKAQLERHENFILKQENEKLIGKCTALKNMVQNFICNKCGSTAAMDESCNQQTQILNENARLKDELSRVYTLVGGPISYSNGPGFMCSPPLGLEIGGEFKQSFWVDYGLIAMQELMCLAHPDSPFWMKRLDGGNEVVNFDEYKRRFNPPPFLRPKPMGFKVESSRETGMMGINSETLAGIFMNVEQWTKIFHSVVARALVLEEISVGIGGTNNGALKLIEAELQIVSPLVPVRRIMFLRFCKQQAEGLWGVVDVSFDPSNPNSPVNNCRRLPSGCVMQDALAGGSSKVTFVEHSEYDESIIHELYRPLVSSGYGFGAQRWLATLQRQCGCVAAILAPRPPCRDIFPAGRLQMLRLANRMVENFCTGICASTSRDWEAVDSKNMGVNLKMMKRMGMDIGVVLNVSTSIWIGVPHRTLFEFLRDNGSRGEWDILADGAPLQEVHSFPKGSKQTDSVSLLRSTVTGMDLRQKSMMVLQETWTDASGSIIVYAPVGSHEIQRVLSDKERSEMTLLPSGFIIVPDGRPTNGVHGSLLSVGFQVMGSTPSMSDLTLESMQNAAFLVRVTLQKIKEKIAGLVC